MAERTTQSWTTAPHFFLSREVDATALNAARHVAGDVSHTDLLVSLVARALAKHPRMNASWVERTVRSHRDINVAIAIAVDDAVVIGVIHGAERLSPADIASRRKELVDRARDGTLQPADIAGATFTISNLGMYQVDALTAVIVPPQAGILAVGAIADRVVAVNGQAVVRPTMTLTLRCDHRVVDGARGAAFLNAVVEAICNLTLSSCRSARSLFRFVGGSLARSGLRTSAGPRKTRKHETHENDTYIRSRSSGTASASRMMAQYSASTRLFAGIHR
jgi:pyruvate dehydrogenase E2 component (dihydrolipoamide acetyltransferase)